MRLVLVLLLAVAVAKTPPQQYKIVSDVPYCTSCGKPLLMDILIPLPRTKVPRLVALWLHAGGWERGDKNGNSGAIIRADAGSVAASIFYRLSGDSPFSADTQDCKCAIRYLRANPKTYGIDLNRIGVAGAFADGHLTENVAAQLWLESRRGLRADDANQK